MERVIEYCIAIEESGKSIEEYLKQRAYTSQSLRILKKTPYSVCINGRWAYLRERLHYQDILRIHIVEREDSPNIKPMEMPLKIVYEDQDIIIIDKDVNMPIHPSLNHYENTLGNALMHYYKEQGKNFVFRCINRLDRDTTGLTIIAKHYVSAGILYQSMKERKIQRTYIAIVDGKYASLLEKGRVVLPIGRVEDSMITRYVDFISGENAITNFKVHKRSKEAMYVELSLETGRTHQIRVHLSYLGCSLLGDELYGGDKEYIGRVALHSKKLVFSHPITKEEISVEVDIHSDMKQCWEVLKRM